MRFLGRIEQEDDESKTKAKKGNELPSDGDPTFKKGDVFTVVENEVEATYVKTQSGWTKTLMDGDLIDAGSY